LAGDLLGEGRDEAFAIDGDAEGGVDPVEELGDVEGGAGLFEYVIGHVNLRQTFSGRRFGGRRVSLAEAADSTELSVERGFEYGQNGIFEIIVHGGLLSMAQRRGWHTKVGLSIELNIDRLTLGSVAHL
jgi:hypothetical protein